MATLTDEKIKEYIEGDGVCCPYCGSQDIEGKEITFDGGKLYQMVYCYSCGANWSDKYQLVGIEEDEG